MRSLIELQSSITLRVSDWVVTDRLPVDSDRRHPTSRQVLRQHARKQLTTPLSCDLTVHAGPPQTWVPQSLHLHLRGDNPARRRLRGTDVGLVRECRPEHRPRAAELPRSVTGPRAIASWFSRLWASWDS